MVNYQLLVVTCKVFICYLLPIYPKTFFGLMTILPSLLSITKNTRTVGRGVQSTFVILFTLLMLSGIGAR